MNGAIEQSRSRWLSAAEFSLGALIVIGHNVYRALPNEVPILLVLGLLSFRLREGSWTAMGLARPTSWGRTVVLALGAAATRVVLGELVISPLAERFWPPAAEARIFNSVAGNLKQALLGLLLVWTFAAFGEEIAYRGYLLNRAADLGLRSRLADWASVLAVSVLFGYGHFYKGPAGVLDSSFAGLVLGAAYLLSGRNLWVCILAHGFIDTFAVLGAYLGWK
jgi:CAAX protease family protein